MKCFGIENVPRTRKKRKNKGYAEKRGAVEKLVPMAFPDNSKFGRVCSSINTLATLG